MVGPKGRYFWVGDKRLGCLKSCAKLLRPEAGIRHKRRESSWREDLHLYSCFLPLQCWVRLA